MASVSVSISANSFTPKDVKAKVGDTVTWTNNDNKAHIVSFDDRTIGSSLSMEPGDTYNSTFEKAGTFKYHCDSHPGMEGTVVVS